MPPSTPSWISYPGAGGGGFRWRGGAPWIWHVIYVLYSLEVGIFFLFLPWTSLWDNNYLLYLYPKLRPVVTNPFFKGAVLGLGLVNILIGIEEIAQLRRKTGRLFTRS
jgi:hypothetical protein